MIPRLRPPLPLRTIVSAALGRERDPVARFEAKFAEQFGFPHALYFAYGRSALRALLEALGWQDEEVVLPAYTCAVVPHAVKLSGNRVRFVDSAKDHFNVPAQNLEARLTSATKMTILTPLFGYPVDRKKCQRAIDSVAPESFVLYDAAHGFACEDRSGVQLESAQGAIFGLGIGKCISTLFGGMLLLRDDALCAEVRAYRDRHHAPAKQRRALSQILYGVATWAAFREPIFSPVAGLESRTPLLDRFTRYYYGQDGISFPADHDTLPTDYQARLGLAQLDDFERLAARRWANSQRYEWRLQQQDFEVFAAAGVATYSQFPLEVVDREGVIADLRRRGVQLGRLVDYCCPDLPGYEAEAAESYPNARRFAERMVNLPNWPGLSVGQIDRVIDALCESRAEHPELYLVPPAVATASAKSRGLPVVK